MVIWHINIVNYFFFWSLRSGVCLCALHCSVPLATATATVTTTIASPPSPCYRAPSQSKRRCYNRNRSWPGFSLFSVRSGPFFMNYIPVLSYCFWSVLFLCVFLWFCAFYFIIFVCSLVALNSTNSDVICTYVIIRWKVRYSFWAIAFFRL